MGHLQKIQYGKKVEVVLLPKIGNEKEVQIALNERGSRREGRTYFE